MRIHFMGFAAVILLAGCTASSDRSGDPWPAGDNEARPWSRWWWPGSDVDRENIDRLMEQYASAGLGGLEITPIYGVRGREEHAIDFLSPAWIEMLQVSLEAASRHGLGIDMNLGTGWPFGGPQVTPEFAAGRLLVDHYEILEPGQVPGRIIPRDPGQVALGATLEALLAWNGDGTMTDLTHRVGENGELEWDPGPGSWHLSAAFCGKTGQMVKRAAPGGEGLSLDHLSREALELYLARFDSAFRASKVLCRPDGSPAADPSVRCFFNDSYEVYNASWTPGFFDYFREKRGYDLRIFLRELTGAREPGSEEFLARLKSDYRETMSELLLENFTAPWTEWSHRKGAGTRNQAHGSPGNLIDLYAAVDIPECEIFGHRTFDIPGMRPNEDDTRNVEPDPMMLKMASSAAHLTGKSLVSNETFTWLGEHFKVALSQCKPEVEEAFLAGINHVFYHGTTYSPGEASWPGWLFYASVHFGPSNSWWTHLSGLNRYITRCQSILQEGQPCNQVLVYWPVHDLWHDAGGLEMQLSVHDVDEWLHFPEIGKMALEGYSYDFISDALLERVMVRDGSMISAEGKVQHGVLVVPHCRLMPLSTLEKIIGLAREGGTVIFWELPEDVPGLYDLENRRMEFGRWIRSLRFTDAGEGVKRCPVGQGVLYISEDLSAALSDAKIAGERLTDFGLKYTCRESGNGRDYFLVNHTARTVDAMVPLNCLARSVLNMDPQDGRFGLARVERDEGRIRVRVQLQPGQSIFLRTYGRKPPDAPPWIYEEERHKPLEIKGPWKLEFLSGGPALPGPVELDAPVNWTSLDDPKMQEFSGIARYSVTFEFRGTAADDYLLRPGTVHESARIRLNGTDLGILWSIPFEVRVGHLLKEGENSLEIKVANLMANRIRAMDRAGIPWRIFRDINFVNIAYEPFDASGWEVEPSGLTGPVVLVPLELSE